MRGQYVIVGEESSSTSPLHILTISGLAALVVGVAYHDAAKRGFLRDPGPVSNERYVSFYNRPGYTGARPKASR